MYMHDYNKGSDHQILFSGEVDLKSRMEFMNKVDDTIVIDVKTEKALGESVRRLRKALYINKGIIKFQV